MSKTSSDPLTSLLENRILEPFIQHIRFPIFKNLEEGTRVEFTYPITALVGTNGTNKSSILRALQGVPGHSNLGNYWFSTAIDPIIENSDGANCFIYGYYNKLENKIVEVIKTRIFKEKDPDYWEPSRAIIKHGMERFNPTVPEASTLSTRWDNMIKEVVYIDFRQFLSAFDKYFYQASKGSFKDRKAHIRRIAPHLRDAIQSHEKKYFYYHNRIINEENRSLSKLELECVSKIIGKEYSEIDIIRHDFLKSDAYTVVMKAGDLRYTEAFAGSGEFAVVRLVTEILNAPERSLILLDEPEVSLHPGAQEKVNIIFNRPNKEIETSNCHVDAFAGYN